MDFFDNIIRRILGYGLALGSLFLMAMMVLIVANIITRLAGHVITGSFELSELMIFVTVAFALGYAALERSHVAVKIIQEKLPAIGQKITEIVNSFLAMCTWAITAWTGSIVLFERWHTEESEMLLIPFYPFRLILFIGLILVTIVYLIFLHGTAGSARR